MLQVEANGKANGLARRLIWLISGVLTLCALAIAFPAGAGAASYSLLVSDSPNRADPVPLDGKTLREAAYAGKTYIFLSRNSPEDVSRVRYYLDDDFVKTENIPPFDLAGTELDLSARPYDITSLANGPHELTAVIDFIDGQSSVSADFTVVRSAPPPPECDDGPFHSPDHYPPACWRPFADGTPFNQRIPADATLASNSSQLVANLMTIGPVNDGRAGMADTCEDWQKVLFWANGSDPVWRIEGGSTVSPYDIDGAQIRMPATAHPAGCTQSPGSDRHLAVIYNGYEYGMWDVHIDPLNRIIYPTAGRKVPVASGDGLNASCTNARFACLAGRIRYQEFAAGRINHALFAATNHLRTGYSYPAMQGSSSNPWLGSNWPQNGTRVQLDPAYATDEWLSQFPPWKRGILRALRDYGAYFGDDTASPLTFTSFESGTGYTALGLMDPFERYAQNHLGQEISQSGGLYYFDLRDGVDWSKLRVIDSCVAERTC